MVNLAEFDNRGFDRGRGRAFEAFWLIISNLLVASWIPGVAHRRWILRRFGAQIGDGVQIKPGFRVKFPWRLIVGPGSWIGEDVWIDNLATVTIGADCCISQGAYLCTGSHDWTKPEFDLVVKTISIEDAAWICAQSIVGPGVVVGEGAVLAMGSSATTSLACWTIYAGHPCFPVKKRVMEKLMIR